MPSVIPGYEYDIFISYRQKDNKGDKWVSEFVDALKTELESTFKEDVSIYFDVNPHDGLLETHDVDASLKEKLKCLVFIPILSRTYCDPKSFAWRNEFEAFVEQASQDQFGLKVRLPNGNIANRVLPVRIHDLDINDINLIESITGGVLRDIEFIYKSEGVNRPLRSKEEKPYENLNSTTFRDQVNKMALAIKEIILGLKGEPDMSVEKSSEHRQQERQFYEGKKPDSLKKKKFLIATGILLLLLIAALFVWPGITGHNNLKRLVAKDGRIPLAIIPFQNLSNDSTLNYLKEWIPECIASYLSNFPEELQVRQTESLYSLPESKTLINNSSIAPSVASLISEKLGANIIISGSMMKSGTRIIINANLLNSKTEGVLKSFHGEGIYEDLNPALDSLSHKIKDYLIVYRLKNQLNRDVQISISTSSPDALKHYIFGRDALRHIDKPDFLNLAHEEYLKSVRIDSTFTEAYFGLITTYANKLLFDSAKFYCLRLYNKRDQMKPQLKLVTEYIYSQLFEMPYDCIKCLNQLLELDDQQPALYLALGSFYQKVNQPDKALPAFEKSLEIYNKWGTKPPTADNYLSLIKVYYDTKQNRKVGRLLKKAERDFPDVVDIYWDEFDLSLEAKDTIAANGYREKIIALSKEYSVSEFDLSLWFAYNYRSKKYPEKAEEYIRKAFTLTGNDPAKLNNLAWYLIIEDVNINKGLELIDQALKLMPDDCTLLDTKGWGLYKLGKYQEALKFLQKADSLKPFFSQDIYDHLEAAKKAVAEEK